MLVNIFKQNLLMSAVLRKLEKKLWINICSCDGGSKQLDIRSNINCSLHKVTLDSSAVTEEKLDTKLTIRPDQSEFGF